MPIPEVYGWCHDKGEVFIFVELVRGVTLESRLHSLGKDDKISVCKQLRGMLVALRQLEQDPRH